MFIFGYDEEATRCVLATYCSCVFCASGGSALQLVVYQAFLKKRALLGESSEHSRAHRAMLATCCALSDI